MKLKNIYKNQSGSIFRTIIYTIGHIFIAASCVIYFTGANIHESLSDDDINIPDGIYNGKFFVAGHVNCNAWIEKIIVLNNSVTIYYRDIIGQQKYKFILNEDKYENRLFRINNIAALYTISYMKEIKSIKLHLHSICSGTGVFKLEQKNKQTEEIDTNKEIDNMIILTTKICEEIGLKNDDILMNKCILTLIRNYKYFKN